MNVLAVFVKNTLLIYASFDLHHLPAIYLKEKKLYIFWIFRGFFYTFCTADSLRDSPKCLRRLHFLGISSLGNWVKFLYFVQSLSLSFVFVSIFICLFIIIIIFWLVLIRHIHFC